MPDELAQRIATLEARMNQSDERHDDLRERIEQSRQERSAQYKDISEKLDTLIEEVTEYRGALQFGKWLAGILIALGIPSAFLYWLGMPK